MEYTENYELEALKYCYQSENISCPKEIRPMTTYLILYFLLSAGIILTIGGNLIVIISISHFKQLHTPTNILILSLAVTDFLLGILLMPVTMVRTVETCWYFGDTICIVYSFFDIALCTISVIHLIFVAIDRYHAVCYPLLYPTKITISVAWSFVTVSWAVPLIYTFLIFYFKGNIKGTEEYNICPGDCIVLFSTLWGLLDTLLTFLLPCTVMLCMYIKVFLVARRHSRLIKCSREQTSSDDNKHINSQRKDGKATKTLGIVMSAFILCWSPYCFNNIFATYSDFFSTPVVVDALGWLAYFNSSFNPLIYALFYPWFQKSFKIIITCKIFNHESSLINLFPSHH
ncbi:trace amine-associated receptor 13c-like [Erpetoichthys calabaricus]|uniref:trace amine-associated receptor 13c-like n=1 Tax=Erpetoichthys calabaricus TaxID=27687 RepID=UPI00223415CA|nr:trace amine-associated receptor 13c-like [Erpetoichthys calabaricus]